MDAVARILVLGSVARDEVVRLKEPLRAGFHLEAGFERTRLGGGAANTGVPLALAGHAVTLVGPIGRDEHGDRLLADLEASGVSTAQLRRVATPTTRSIVLIDPGGERTIVNLARAREPEPPARVLGLPADCLYVRSRADDLEGLLAAKADSCLVVAHVPPCHAGARPAHVLVASEPDLPPEVRASPWEWGRRIAGERLRFMVLTRGADGARAMGAEGSVEVAAPVVEAVDTTGAGDAFAAGLIHALVNAATIRRALEVGCAWGAAKAGSDGSVLARQVVERLVRAAPSQAPSPRAQARR
jgi:sugar/nucleoside kinase (ribokinase family)